MGACCESKQPFNPRETALLEIWPGALLKELRVSHSNQFATQPEARLLSYEPNRLLIETQSDKPSVLVVSEINYPGWAATIDGIETTIYATDYLLRGIILPAGKHQVAMRYTASAARSGALISAATLLLLCGLFVKTRRGRSKS